MDKSRITISPINEIADINTRNKVYREFLKMLNLDIKHRRYLESQGFLKSTIENQMYRTIPKNYIKRRLIASKLKNRFNLAGIPGFFQEDWGWNFINARGFFVPMFDEKNRIQALSIHLDESFNGTNIDKIIFTIRPTENQNLDYIINRVFRDLIPFFLYNKKFL